MADYLIPTDEAWLAELEIRADVQRELDARYRQVVRDWGLSQGQNVHMAAISVTNGRWDDVVKDLWRERVTLDEALAIVGQMEKYKLWTPLAVRGITAKFTAAWDYRHTYQAEGRQC
ncbi:MAG: hypothetical protein FOGNACKC_00867 [Anaerolineae bacterium]|nr:hypothetical protein [Anaerolineae bacterium]